jgi:hypothetical protein
MKIMSRFRLVMSKPAPSNDATPYHSKAGRFLYPIEHLSKKTQSYKKNPIAWAFLVAPQKASKKSQATRKACLPCGRAAFLLLTAEKVSRESPLVALFDLSLPPQPAGYTRFPFTANRSQSDAVSRRKPARHPRYPRHPWLIYGSPCPWPRPKPPSRMLRPALSPTHGWRGNRWCYGEVAASCASQPAGCG